MAARILTNTLSEAELGEPRPGNLSHGNNNLPTGSAGANVDRLGQGDIQYVAAKPCGATQRATHVLVLAHQTGDELELPMGDGPRFQDAAPAGRASQEAGVHWAHLAPDRERSLNYSVKQGKHRYDCASRRANQKHRIPECSGRIRHQAGSGAQAAQSGRMGHFRRFTGCTRIQGWEPPRRLRAQTKAHPTPYSSRSSAPAKIWKDINSSCWSTAFRKG